MAIRIVLLCILGATGYYGFMRRNRVPVHIVIVLGLLAVGAGFVLFPESANILAHWMGVGRGADLVSYVVEASLLFVALHYYTKFVDLDSKMTQLARELTLLRAETEDRLPVAVAAAEGAREQARVSDAA